MTCAERFPSAGRRPEEKPGGEALRIAVIGSGAAGSFASLMLARAGYEVIVLERDRLEPAPDAESAAASAFRPTAPQVVHPHVGSATRSCAPPHYSTLPPSGATGRSWG